MSKKKEPSQKAVKTSLSLPPELHSRVAKALDKMPKPKWTFSGYIAHLLEVNLEKDIISEHRDVEVALSPKPKAKRNASKGTAAEGTA